MGKAVYDLLLSSERGKVIGYAGVAHKDRRNATNRDSMSMTSVTLKEQPFHQFGENLLIDW